MTNTRWQQQQYTAIFKKPENFVYLYAEIPKMFFYNHNMQRWTLVTLNYLKHSSRAAANITFTTTNIYVKHLYPSNSGWAYQPSNLAKKLPTHFLNFKARLYPLITLRIFSKLNTIRSKQLLNQQNHGILQHLARQISCVVNQLKKQTE